MATFTPMSSGSDRWAEDDQHTSLLAPRRNQQQGRTALATGLAVGAVSSVADGSVPSAAAAAGRKQGAALLLPSSARNPSAASPLHPNTDHNAPATRPARSWAWLHDAANLTSSASPGSGPSANPQRHTHQARRPSPLLQHARSAYHPYAHERTWLLTGRDRLASSSASPIAGPSRLPGSSDGPTTAPSPRSARRSGHARIGSDDRAAHQPLWKDAFRPHVTTVERWLNSWWKRWVVLAVAPSLVVWFWCAMPFPRAQPEDADVPGSNPGSKKVDANFWFFLLFYYGIYCAVALIYITQLFSLYRLNWWPRALGARTSYFTFWLLSLCAGYALHTFSLDARAAWLPRWLGGSSGSGSGHDKTPDRPTSDDDIQWQRKTLWVGLAFATMAMPALVCLAGLRRSGRQTYRHSLTEAQKTFLERQLARRIPASYTRFLWFMSTIGLALVALLAGQGYASIYLSSLPHTGFEGTAYVMFWTVNVNVLMLISIWILEEKVRSRALLFCFKYYYFLVYFIFYRNLFARLRSFDQFALIQLLSSFWVCIWYPFSMTSLCHRVTQYFNPNPRSWEEYVESVGLAFYLRNLAQNTTMLAFLGWVSILHFGSNQHLYPFFAFDDERDPYNYQLTMLGSLAIWASELLSSFLARWLCLFCFDVDITNLGLDEMRQHPELVTSVVWTSVHVLQDCLLFLIRLDFR